jgi:hypothetical protein
LNTPFVHGAYAAGKLSCGFWDHWVPGANEPLARLCRAWADKEKVDLTVDFITSQGDKLALTATAEGQAGSGHDILQLSYWYAAAQADNFQPVDDLVTALIEEYGKVLLGSNISAARRAVDCGPDRTQTTGQIPCARIDYFKQFVGLRHPRMYPAARRRLRRSPTPGPGTGFSTPPRSAPRPVIRSAAAQRGATP